MKHSAFRSATVIAAAILASRSALGTDITGVLPASVDQPLIHFYLTTVADPTTPLVADDGMGDTTIDVQAYLDTGSSGVLLSLETASAFNIPSSTYNNQAVTFYDSGVAGTGGFSVSGPYRLATAPNVGTNNDVNYGGSPPDFSQYLPPGNPIRLQLSNDPADDLIGPLDIAGTPILAGNVIVIDPKPLNLFLAGDPNGDTLHSYLYPRGTAYKPATADSDPGIPSVNRHVRVSITAFDRFTITTPAGALGPTLAGNPMIGPDPVMKLDGITQPNPPAGVTVTMGTKSTVGTFLLDTGAQASFISTAVAAAVGVHYDPTVPDGSDPVLLDASGNPVPDQFIIAIGGIGGTVDAAGFYLDSLSLPTVEGDPIVFKHAPVLVNDVALTDPSTGKTFTLDGDFGVNFLVASSAVDLSDLSPGAFDWITYDQTAGILGLQLSSAYADPIVVAAGTTYHFTATAGTGVVNTAVGGLTINAGGRAIVDAAAHHTDRQVVVTSGLTLSGATSAWTSLLDLNNNDLIVSGGDLATITDQVKQGFHAGAWNGAGGIISSSAAADSKHLMTLGVIQNDQGGTPIYDSSNPFDGVTPGASDILVRYTYFGDANLDGKVDGSDYSLLDNGFLNRATATGWYNGDFNYDGKIDASDYSLIDNAYNRQTADLSVASLVATPGAAVPEPAEAGLMALSFATIRRRRPARRDFSTTADETTAP